MKNNKIILYIILFVGAFHFFDLTAMQGEQGVLRISQVNQSITNASSENNKLNNANSIIKSH